MPHIVSQISGSTCQNLSLVDEGIGIDTLPQKTEDEPVSVSVACSDVNGQMERVKGIEPSYAAWEAAVLPLNYTRSGTKA